LDASDGSLLQFTGKLGGKAGRHRDPDPDGGGLLGPTEEPEAAIDFGLGTEVPHVNADLVGPKNGLLRPLGLLHLPRSGFDTALLRREAALAVG
jgi:hypothetical protein